MKDKVIEKIQKLLRLSRGKGATEAEAILASEKANALLIEHNLSMADLGEDTGTRAESEEDYAFPWVKEIYHWVAKLNLCICCFSEQRGNAQKSNYMMIGSPVNVQIARENARYLVRTVLKSARKARKPASFSYGMSDNIVLRLKMLYLDNVSGKTPFTSSTGKEVVLTEMYDKANEAAFKKLEQMDMDINFVGQRARRQGDPVSYAEGWQKGQDTALGLEKQIA